MKVARFFFGFNILKMDLSAGGEMRRVLCEGADATNLDPGPRAELDNIMNHVAKFSPPRPPRAGLLDGDLQKNNLHGTNLHPARDRKSTV